MGKEGNAEFCKRRTKGKIQGWRLPGDVCGRTFRGMADFWLTPREHGFSIKQWEGLNHIASKLHQQFVLLHLDIKETLMATQADLTKRLQSMKEQNEKAAKEQADALQKVRDELAQVGGAGGVVSAELVSAVDALEESIKKEDDLNPDATDPNAPPAVDPNAPTT